MCSRFHANGVTLGYYPDWFHNYYKTKLIIESMDPSVTSTAVEYLTNKLPSNSIVNNSKFNKFSSIDPLPLATCKATSLYQLFFIPQ